ncbi:MAG: InlB B-repeat-containing protein [Muribaculaceae bacterium]|nr:InlB B-repeat-containing protein [Muribaculaceae bacterium]
MKINFIKVSLMSALVALCGGIAVSSMSGSATRAASTTADDRPLLNLDKASASALFLLDKGTENLKAELVEEDYFLSSKVTWGSALTPDGGGVDANDPDRFYAGQDNKGYKQLWFNPTTKVSSANDDNSVNFLIQPRFGLAFTPEKVSFKTTRYGTDGGKLDIFWVNPDGSKVKLAEGISPYRDNSSPAILEWSANIDASNIKVAPGQCGLSVAIYSLDNGKHVGFSNVSLQGTISGQEIEMPVLQSFAANGVTYQADDTFKPDGDGYTATIELFSYDPMISASNPVTDVTPSTGTVGAITYSGDNSKCDVTIPLTLKDITVNYVAKFVRKPSFTITYVDTDGSSMGTQKVEKDTPIGKFDVDYTKAKAKTGYKVRGWFVNSMLSAKAKTSDIMTGNISLYALQTEEEVASTSRKYSFDLTSDIFYPEDHEAFNLEEGTGYYHDNKHGWAFKHGDKIQLLVGPKATVALTLCQYGYATTFEVADAAGNKVCEPFAGKDEKDATLVSFNYEGEPGYITMTMNADGGEIYLHNLTIYNNAEPSYTQEGQWYFVKPGDVWSLFDALDAANAANTKSDSPRAYIFLPNGVYDMEDRALTKITGYNISLIGQSMDGTKVVNAPNIKNEGIGTTATFLNSSNGLYIQDMTLQNALDYYKAGSAGRAVVLQDKGTKTICKNVAMLSYQDTYYSNNNDGLFYFDGSKVAGTVDFFCGGGTMFMENSIIQVEKRNADGKGECTITAPATAVGKPYGYVFSNCTIMNYAEKYNLGRAWQGEPRCAYINTKVNDNKMNTNRWTAGGMSVVAKEFVEYNTTDMNGKVVSPSSKVIEFTKDNNKNKMETILTAEQAERFTIDKVFPNWQPRELAKQVAAPAASYDSKNISWSPVEGAIAYAIFKGNDLVAITSETSYPLEGGQESDNYSIRSANSMGGLGEAYRIPGLASIHEIEVDSAEVVNVKYYNLQGVAVDPSSKGILVKVSTFSNGKKETSKIVNR